MPTDPTQADPSIVALMHGLKTNEGGTDYNALGDKNAQGQPTAAGIGQWSNQENGVPQPLSKGQIPINFANDAKQYGLDPADFSPENQNKVMYSVLADDKKKGLTPEQALSKWNSGGANNYLTNSVENTSVDASKTQDVAAYVKRGMAAAQAYAQQKKNGGYNPKPYSNPDPGTNPGAVDYSGSTSSSEPTQPEGLGGKALDVAKGVGNFLFPVLGDISSALQGKGNGKTALQVAGDTGLSVLPFIPGLGAAGEGARVAEGAIDATKTTGLLSKVVNSTIGRGAAVGYGAGALSNLSNGQGVIQSIIPNSTNLGGALTGGVASALIPKLAGVLNKGKAALQKSIQDTMPLENKATRIDALRSSLPGAAGGVTRKGLLGTSTIQPSEEDVARGTAAHPYINGVSDPVDKIRGLNQGIQTESEKTDSFLDANAAPANFSDMRDYMETNRPPINLQKDPGAAEAYIRATQDALDTLYATMKKTANETGDFGAQTSGSSIRQARIAIDQQISKELGENTFGTPQYRGIKAAEIDTRNLLNRMNEDMLRYPGQLAELNKLNQFISESKARGIEIDMNNPTVRSQLEGKFGLTSTAQGEANAQKLAQQHGIMSNLYDARDNLIDKYQNKIGKNKLEEMITNNPVAKTVSGVLKKAIPFGVADHLIIP